jgi:hypothetical protein
MRPLIAGLLLLLASSSFADSWDDRRFEIAERARAAAAGMGRLENYVEFLEPVPDRLITAPQLRKHLLFGEGWSRLEPWGIWSLGKSSIFWLRLPPGASPVALYFDGRYIGGEEPTTVRVNGQWVADSVLLKKRVELPPGIAVGQKLLVELGHRNPVSPHELNPSVGDRRPLKYGLSQLQVIPGAVE